MKIDDILDEKFFAKDSYQEKHKGLQVSEQEETFPTLGEEIFSVDVYGKEWIFHSQTERYDEDTDKTRHYVFDPDGKEYFMDWSPYSNPTEKVVQMWIQLGMPNRAMLDIRRTIDQESLVKYAHKQGLRI